MAVFANVAPYNKELCFIQPGHLYPAALGMANAIAYRRLIEKKKVKSESCIIKCLVIYQKTVGLCFSFLFTMNIALGFNEVLGFQP